jgi:protein-L-isoaspartate(D-aspartate) O-methyltransferase
MDPAVVRDDMVDSLTHESKGCLSSAPIADAMRTVPRDAFVPDDHESYADRAVEREGSRILAPSTVARLFESLDLAGDGAVLIVGTGVGYTAAIAAELVGGRNVHTVDIDRRLVLEARSNLADTGYGGVLVDCRDGADGLPEYAPFDRILLEAAAVEPPAALVAQLAPGGRLVMAQGTGDQELVVVGDEGAVTHRAGPIAFRPMLVDGEQATAPERNRMHREDRERAERAAEGRTGWEQDWIDWDEY